VSPDGSAGPAGAQTLAATEGPGATQGGAHTSRVRTKIPRYRARANPQKPSGIAAKGMILRVHPVSVLRQKRLDAIKSQDVQQLRNRFGMKAEPVNNVLTVLSVLRCFEDGSYAGRKTQWIEQLNWR